MSQRRRNLFILLLVGVLLAGSVVAIVAKPTRLGLDLKGGVELTYQAKGTKFAALTGESVDRAIDIMRKRVDALGVSEPEIQRFGQDQIAVSLPNVTNAAEAASQVGTTAQLFFYDWEKNVLDANCRPAPTDFAVTGGSQAGQAGGVPLYTAVTRASKCPAKTNQPTSSGAKFYLVDKAAKKVIAGPEGTERDLRESDAAVTSKVKDPTVLEVPEGVTLVQSESNVTTGPGPDSWYVLNDSFTLRGPDIKNPEQNTNQAGQASVTFDFTDSGRKKWQDATREIAQRGSNFIATADGQTVSAPELKRQHFAIVLDNRLISVPYIDYAQNPDGIDGGTGSEISGSFTIKSAQNLADQLKYGALPVSLDLISQSQVSATLGQQALDQGLLAAIIGFIVVALFLLVFYRLLGVLAVAALCIYAVYLFALIKLIPVTLTLPGLAGLVLTIGVCADANIVIYERIKEEVVNGKSISTAISTGYRRGLSTIVDANVVTLLTAFILFMLSSAGVRGFALTLGLGTIVTLFSAVLATQALLGVTGSGGLSNPRLVGARTHGKKRRLDFNGATKWLFSLSGIILLAGALAIATRGLEFGIDFKSGTRTAVAFNQNVSEDQVRNVLEQDGLEGAEVQRVSNSELGANVIQISTGQLAPGEVNDVTRLLGDRLGGIRGSPETQSIGPTFGNTVARQAGIAVLVSLLVIAAYIALRFEWKYAATTAISLMHDLLITAGLYALTGREVNSATVAALLTVLGFSLYDTIIVSDRMRENTPRMPRATFAQISNRSMNEVIVRSLSTVTCASLPILALLLFGGDTLQDFAFALLVGTVSGAYSSIFISSPVLTQWKEREPVYRRRRAAYLAQYGEVPAFADEKLDVRTDGKPKARRTRLSDDPAQGVSKSEFDDMVRDLHAEPGKPKRGASVAEREPDLPPKPAPSPDDARDATPEELVYKDPKDKRPRNKRHGRPR